MIDKVIKNFLLCTAHLKVISVESFANIHKSQPTLKIVSDNGSSPPEGWKLALPANIRLLMLGVITQKFDSESFYIIRVLSSNHSKPVFSFTF